jgi:hypothetical protein
VGRGPWASAGLPGFLDGFGHLSFRQKRSRLTFSMGSNFKPRISSNPGSEAKTTRYEVTHDFFFCSDFSPLVRFPELAQDKTFRETLMIHRSTPAFFIVNYA